MSSGLSGYFAYLTDCNRVKTSGTSKIHRTENRRECAPRRKSAWARLKRQDPEGINPRGLALNKNR